MAVVNVKSTIVSNYDAQPRVLTNGYISGAPDTTGCGIVPLGATDSATSVYRIAFLPSGVLLSDLAIMNDANPRARATSSASPTTRNRAARCRWRTRI